MNFKDLKDKAKKSILYSVIGMASFTGQPSSAQNNSKEALQNHIDKIKDDIKTQKAVRTASFAPTLRDVKYYNSVGDVTGWSQGASYVPHLNLIYNIQEPNESQDDLISQLIHEIHHKDDYNQGFLAHDMSFEEAFKLRMHAEITANIAECLSIRNDYIQAQDKTAFLDRIEKSSYCSAFKFYTDQLRNKTITPEKNTDKQTFDEEMSFIVNGTRKMWLNQNYSLYESSLLEFADGRRYIKGITGESNPENYQKSLDITYTMGGINLSKYLLTDDLPITPKAKEYLSKITVDKKEQKYSLDTVYNQDENVRQTSSMYEKTPRVAQVLDLSPNSKLLLTEYEQLNDSAENSSQLKGIEQLNDNLSQQLSDEYPSFNYTLGTIDKVRADLIKRGCSREEYGDEMYATRLAEKICEKYGNDSEKIIDMVSKVPNIMMERMRPIKGRYSIDVKSALDQLAEQPRLSSQKIEALMRDNFDDVQKFLKESLGINDTKGNYIIPASAYLQSPEDYNYLASAMKSASKHPELWGGTTVPNGHQVGKLLFSENMTPEKFKKLQKTHSDMIAISNALSKRAKQENADISKSEKKITEKDVLSLAKHLYSVYGLEKGQIIAQAIAQNPKQFGEKSLAKLIHLTPPKYDYEKPKYNEKKSTQDKQLHESIARYAKQIDSTQTANQATLKDRLHQLNGR